MFCFINLTPQTPPSVIHGWKATDLLYEMVKTKKIFFHPVKRQIFDDAPKQTFYMISKLVIDAFVHNKNILNCDERGEAGEISKQVFLKAFEIYIHATHYNTEDAFGCNQCPGELKKGENEDDIEWH